MSEDLPQNKTRPLRVLSITVRADIGGGPEHLYQLLANLPKDLKHWVACPDDVPYFSKYISLVGRNAVLLISHRRFRFLAFIKLLKLCRERRFDLIHSHGKGAGLYSRMLGRLAGVPVVHTFHGLHVGEYGLLKKSLYLGLESLLGRWTAAAICVSHGEQRLIEKAGLLPMDRLRIIENGVTIPAEISEKAVNGNIRIVAINRFNHQKNPELILDIADALRKQARNIDFKIDVYGTGDGLHGTRELILQRKLDDVVFLHGAATNIRDQLRKADLFLSTSRWEGMPLAVLEAMSEGVPVVVTDVVGNRDIVQNSRTGFLFELNRPGEAVDIIENLCIDPVLRVHIGCTARLYVKQNHSVQKMAQETHNLYKEVHQ